MWLGRWWEGQNPIFLHHCEGAPGPVPGETFAARKSQAILDGSGTSQPLIIITPFVYSYHSYQSSTPTPGFLMVPTSGLVKCW